MLISLTFTAISEDMAKDGGEGQEGEEGRDEEKKITINYNHYKTLLLLINYYNYCNE